MIDNYSLFEIHERKQIPYLEDCQGVAIYEDEPYYVLDGKIFSQQTIDECKHWFETE